MHLSIHRRSKAKTKRAEAKPKNPHNIISRKMFVVIKLTITKISEIVNSCIKLKVIN